MQRHASNIRKTSRCVSHSHRVQINSLVRARNAGLGAPRHARKQLIDLGRASSLALCRTRCGISNALLACISSVRRVCARVAHGLLDAPKQLRTEALVLLVKLAIQRRRHHCNLLPNQRPHVAVERVFRERVLYVDAVALADPVSAVLSLHERARVPIQFRKHDDARCGERDANTSRGDRKQRDTNLALALKALAEARAALWRRAAVDPNKLHASRCFEKRLDGVEHLAVMPKHENFHDAIVIALRLIIECLGRARRTWPAMRCALARF
mmetsp:Transcript_11253/g.30286  ORF Transcript_11253/g.30286 Transcript_11253/m.30286 type:complete len:269 (-) Transcript_11253:1750-2556(-)